MASSLEYLPRAGAGRGAGSGEDEVLLCVLGGMIRTPKYIRRRSRV